MIEQPVRFQIVTVSMIRFPDKDEDSEEDKEEKGEDDEVITLSFFKPIVCVEPDFPHNSSFDGLLLAVLPKELCP